MPKDVKIKKGLNLNLVGEAEKSIVDAPISKTYSIKPPNFHSVVPKMLVKEGAQLKAGDELFFSKYAEETRFVSPVSGVLKEIVRGEKRRVLELIIEADENQQYKDFGKTDPLTASNEEVKTKVFASGLGAFINQRPYDIIANAKDTPKAIFVSTYNTAPLGADFALILKDRMSFFQTGINVLTKLTPGTVYLGVDAREANAFKEVENAEILHVSGPHPAGNVGVQINEVSPINAGERVWTVRPEDVAIIGELFETGKFNPVRTIALVGNASEESSRKYYRTKIGAEVRTIIGSQTTENVRVINGDVLTGHAIDAEKHINYYANELTLIPEGNEYRMFGWLPFKDNHIHSAAKTSLAWLFPNKKYNVNTNLNGEERALVVTGEMEAVMPLDVYPMQLIKACMAGDIEKMESYGIYEVAPEDFALVDYTNTSKIEAQDIIRQGLDLMITEVG